MNKNDIGKLKESFAFLLQEINAPIDFEISIINQFYDVDDYEVNNSSDNLPIYHLPSEEKYKEWETIFNLGYEDKMYSRTFYGYREFLSLIQKGDAYSYSFVIIHIKLNEYQKLNFYEYDLYTDNNEWKRELKFPTFFDFLIESFLYAYSDMQKLPYKDIIRRAAEAFISETLLSDTIEQNLNIYNDINILSALKYEKSDNSGTLLICKDIKEIIATLDTQLIYPIGLYNYKKIRKLFEIAVDEILLIGTPRRVYGFITKDKLSRLPNFIGFQVKIHGALNWELSKYDSSKEESTSLIQCKDSSYQYTKPKFSFIEFCDIINSRFVNSNVDSLSRIISLAVKQRHGTTVVITDNAEAEAKRLASSSFPVKPTYSETMIKYLTSIDGAVLFDPLGNCYAIGVILDGHTSETEDISNGARHNSARRYKNINPNCIIIIVSEDGHITNLY